MSVNQQLDYAKAEDFSMALERLGGENLLREKFPNILQMLHNTREWHQELSKEDAAEDESTGYEDTFEIVNLCKNPAKNSDKNAAGDGAVRVSGSDVLSESSMSLVQKAPFLHISTVIQDPKFGKVFASDAVHDTDANNLKVGLTVNHDALNYTANPSLETRSDFMAVGKVNGKSVCVADRTSKVLTIDLAESKPDIIRISVKQPVPKNEKDAMRIVYGQRNDPTASYIFNAAQSRTLGDVRYVEVYFPFSIEVELDEDFQYYDAAPVSFGENFLASLASDVVKGGSVHFNTVAASKIKTTLNDKKNKLLLDFSYENTTHNYWEVQMPLTKKQTEGWFNFHLQFTVQYTFKNYPGEIFRTPILVTSEDLPPSTNMVKVKQAKIVWGCLGKDTQLLTENGYRPITEIKPGDKLYTDKGYIKLKNMVTGTEGKIVAVGVTEERTLLLTEKHPIATERGVIYADDLAVGDKLKMDDGSFREIYYLEVIDYNDRVYSPELEESALIAADGIMVGDYLTTADAVEETEKEPEPLEPELLEELIRWSEYQKEKMKEELAREEA